MTAGLRAAARPAGPAVVAVLLAAGYVALPGAGAARPLLLLLAHLLAAGAVVAAGGGRDVRWRLVAAVTAAGGVAAAVAGVGGFPGAPATAGWVCAAVDAAAVAVVAALGGRAAVRRGAVLDAAVVTSAAAMAAWVFCPADAPTAVAVVVVVELLLCAVGLTVAFGGGPGLLCGWVLLRLAGDVTAVAGGPAGGWGAAAGVAWIAALGLLAGAVRGAAAGRVAVVPRAVRYGLVAAALLAPPLLLVARAVRSSGADLTVIAGGSVLVTALLVARVAGAGPGGGHEGTAAAQRGPVLRLTAAFLLLTLLPLGGLTYLAVSEAHRTVETEVRRRLPTSAAVTAAHVDNQLTGLRELVSAYAERRLLAAELAAPRPAAGAVRRHVVGLRARVPDCVGAWVLDVEGRPVAQTATDPPPVTTEAGRSDLFLTPRSSGDAHVSGVFTAALPGAPRVVAVSAPVTHRGRFVGVIGMAYRTDALRAFTDALAEVQQVGLHVADAGGTPITGPDGLLAPHVRAALAGRQDFDRSTGEAQDLISAYKPVPRTGWAVVAELPAPQAYAGADRFTSRVLAVALLLAQVLLAGLVLAVRTERRRRRAESDVADARDEAVRASRLKSDFVANVSHEIRTPMNGVIGLTSLLAETPLNAQQRDYVSTLQTSADALLGVINDILDFSKIEAGKLVIDPVDFAPGVVAGEVAALVAADAHRKGLTLTTTASPAPPPLLRGDAHRIRQVLTNLVSNAVKFTAAGTVDIDVTVGPADADGVATARFTVRDTGIGVAADRQAQLFAPFVQADTSTTRRYGGSGLGLTISRQLVELMGGEIGVASQPGQGSTFWFTLPLPVLADAPPGAPDSDAPPGADDAAAAAGAPHSTGGAARILVAEDNEVNQKVVTALLTSLGYRWDVAGDGAEALRLAGTGRYDAILMDVQMPHMDGLEATRRVRRLPAPLGATPVIALTASALRADEQRCRDAGMDDFLSKPVRRAGLAAALRTLRPAPEAGPQSAPAPSTPTPTPPAAAAAAGAPPAVPHAPVLDAAALAELVEMGPAFTGRILPSFLRNAGDLAAGISAAAATADHAEVARLAHQLKGSSGTMAGRRLAAVCQAAEAAARQQDGAQVRVLAAAVDQATAELCRALQETVRPASPVD